MQIKLISLNIIVDRYIVRKIDYINWRFFYRMLMRSNQMSSHHLNEQCAICTSHYFQNFRCYLIINCKSHDYNRYHKKDLVSKFSDISYIASIKLAFSFYVMRIIEYLCIYLSRSELLSIYTDLHYI